MAFSGLKIHGIHEIVLPCWSSFSWILSTVSHNECCPALAGLKRAELNGSLERDSKNAMKYFSSFVLSASVGRKRVISCTYLMGYFTSVKFGLSEITQ